jgi:hypothetical protein
VYQRFCVNFEKQRGFVRALEQLPDFVEYLRVCRNHESVGKNDLSALLIAPMKHQCHYQLLLEVCEGEGEGGGGRGREGRGREGEGEGGGREGGEGREGKRGEGREHEWWEGDGVRGWGLEMSSFYVLNRKFSSTPNPSLRRISFHQPLRPLLSHSVSCLLHLSFPFQPYSHSHSRGAGGKHCRQQTLGRDARVAGDALLAHSVTAGTNCLYS